MDHLLSALLLCVCATPIYPSTLSPSDVAQASFGSFDFKELEEILYDVEIGSLPTTAALFDSKHNIQQDTDPPSSTDETHKEPKVGIGDKGVAGVTLLSVCRQNSVY